MAVSTTSRRLLSSRKVNVSNLSRPTPPIMGTAFAASTTSITIPFGTPVSDGGTPITGYTAITSPSGATVTGAAGPLTVTGLTQGSTYTFVVYATNILGNSSNSSTSNPVTTITVPNAPTIGTATVSTYGAISVPFTAPANDGGNAITSYTVTATPGGLTATGSSSPLVVSGLTGGTFYTFKVKATNGIGTGAESTASNSIMVTGSITNTVAPSITGTSGLGNTLTVGNGTWTTNSTTISSYTYQWYRGGNAISGATNSTYTQGDNDVALTITASVMASAPGASSVTVNSSNTIGPFYAQQLTTTLNAGGTGSVAVAWNNFTTGSPTTYQVLLDGSLQTTTTAPTTTATLTISSGANRVLTVTAYNGAAVMSSVTKNIRFFAYTGGSQSWTVPSGAPAYIVADVQGAQGGEAGGRGGRTKAYFTANNNETVYLYVGGKGTPDTYAGRTGCVANTYWAGGFNGGGNGGGNYAGCAAGASYQLLGSGGGGASDIRRNGTALADRIMVSGGGGGCGPASGFVNSGCGGDATNVGQGAGYNTGAGSGGVSGQSGCGGGWPISSAGGAASTSSGGSAGTGDETVGNVGSLGQGANGNFSGEGSNNPGRGSGGGGGYYGGGSGGINSNYGSGGSGGGGSGYLDSGLTTLFSNFGTSAAGYNTGHGQILLVW